MTGINVFGFRTPQCDDTVQMLDDMRTVEPLPRDRFERDFGQSYIFAAMQQDGRILGRLLRRSVTGR